MNWENDLAKWAIYWGCLLIAASNAPLTLSPSQLPVEPSKKLLATLEETFTRLVLGGAAGKDFIGCTDPEGV